MTDTPDPIPFMEAKQDVVENLEAIQLRLVQNVEQGMVDLDDSFYNELLDLIGDAAIVDSWEELAEIITKGKTLEVDIDAWLSLHGVTTLSLFWPKIK